MLACCDNLNLNNIFQSQISKSFKYHPQITGHIKKTKQNKTKQKQKQQKQQNTHINQDLMWNHITSKC